MSESIVIMGYCICSCCRIVSVMAYRGRDHHHRGRGGGRNHRGGRGGGDVREPADQQIRPIHALHRYWSRDDITQVARSSSADVVQKIQQEEGAFLNAYTFNKNYQNKYTMDKLIKILNSLCISQEVDFSSRKLSQVVTECAGFMMKLKELAITTEDENCLQHLVNIFRFCVDKIPQTTIFSLPHSELKDTIEQLDDNQHRLLKRTFDEYCKQYDLKKQEMRKMRKEEQLRSSSSQSRHGSSRSNKDSLQNLHDQQPPNNFREIQILPQPDEFKHGAEKPFLRPVIIRGSYRNWEHYLDVQFRLLREDFMSPLRDGIHEYLTDNKKNKSIHLYNDATILNPVCLYAGIGFTLRFDIVTSRLTRVRWEHSRRLIFGSLLCLSSDNFKTILFASVVKRDPEHLKDGYLTVKFEGNVNGFSIDPTTIFTIVESTAYFEAFRHVLEGLQQVAVDQMPFTPYIVGGFDYKDPIPLPLCIRRNPVYDLNRVLELKKATVPIDVRRWPLLPNICLDESQVKAFKMALSQQVSILQGPPGTGKTYIGLKIVQALLQNRNVWDPMGNSPILVVCYTNHALDQFLDGIIDVPIKGAQKPKIVRVGGRCKSEKIKECAMANLVYGMKTNREVPGNVYREVRDNRNTMKVLQEEIENQIGAINAMEGKMMTVEDIDNVMDDRHCQQIMYGLQGVPEHRHLEVWLNLWLLPAYDDGEHEMNDEEQLAAALEASLHVGQNEAEAGLQANMGMGLEQPIDGQQVGGLVIEGENVEGLIDVVDEPQILQDDRMIEGEIIELGHNGNGQKNMPQQQAKQIKEKVTKKGGWEMKQLTQKERKNRISKGMQNRPMRNQEAVNVVDAWALSVKDRWRLYQYWLNQHIRRSKASLKLKGQQYDRCAQQCIETDHELNKLTLRNADVVGMTTTGAAKHSYILKHFHPKIVMVEEAAEVLESHVITSLCASVEQLILIGDHKQLQPKITCFDLEKYDLHVSLFERLAIKGFPIATLKVQHRMRPEIASIVRNHIYDKKLEDHETVFKYDHIKGVGKDLYFIEHCEVEKTNPTGDQRSHANPFEADYVVSLTRHLLKQGYSPDEITILTMYSGQLFVIKQRMKRDEFGGIRVTAVDDFQGEENEIVIISLVRSNNEGSIGFLKVPNRICVSLSRAKKGMYVIGNFAMLRDKKDTKWPDILDQMEHEKCLGEGLPLCCQIHPQEIVVAKIPQDFSKCPEGGCRKQCSTRLDCGHVCQSPCHPLDREHKMLYRCQQKCDKKLPCGHKCGKRCYDCQDGCPPCEINVSRELPFCHHEVRMKCCDDPSKVQCKRPCDRRISRCGHKCQSKCSQPCTSPSLCQALVPQKLSCGHVINVACSNDQSSIVCPKPCKKLVESCNHECKGTCGTCSQGRLHVQCKKECGRSLNCGHICDFPCPEYCPPCSKQCRNYCFHSKCPKKCYEPCVPCREPCKWECRHCKCSTACGELCDRPPCDEPCNRRIKKCGHPCIGLCGEDCPPLCRICDKDEVTEIFFGTEDEEGARFIQLKDCEHVFEMSGLDQWMESQNAAESQLIKFIECPKCKTPIRRSLRYGNIIKKTINDMERIKILNLNPQGVTTTPQELQRLAKITKTAMKVPTVKEVCSRNVCARIDNAISFAQGKPNVPPLLPQHINTIENQINLLNKLDKLFECFAPLKAIKCQFGSGPLVVCMNTVLKEAMSLLNFLKAEYLSPQQAKDAECELRRLFCLSRICQIQHNAHKEGKKFEAAHEGVLEKQVEFYIKSGITVRKTTAEDQEKIDKVLEIFKKCYSIGELTKSEKMEIVKAVTGVTRGAWYSCPKGHFYAIGDCGGATQIGQCPDCGSRIGGTGHQLVTGNTHAGEMDGSQHAAWSEGANLANFDQQQLDALFH